MPMEACGKRDMVAGLGERHPPEWAALFGLPAPLPPTIAPGEQAQSAQQQGAAGFGDHEDEVVAAIGKLKFARKAADRAAGDGSQRAADRRIAVEQDEGVAVRKTAQRGEVEVVKFQDAGADIEGTAGDG